MTQRVMAARCGLSQSTISRVENGLAPGLRIAWLARILAGLHRDPGPPGLRSWEAWTPPTLEVLIRPFAPGGTVERLVHEAETSHREEVERNLMQLQASLEGGAKQRERESSR
jgi:transcriptional regulator with XRE-family HTH domain